MSSRNPTTGVNITPEQLQAVGIRIAGKFNGYVFQRVDPRFANAATPRDPRLQIRENPDQFDPQTPAQMEQRTKMPLAVAAWQALTPEEKADWNRRRTRASHATRYNGRVTYFSGYTYFLSLHMKGEI